MNLKAERLLKVFLMVIGSILVIGSLVVSDIVLYKKIVEQQTELKVHENEQTVFHNEVILPLMKDLERSADRQLTNLEYLLRAQCLNRNETQDTLLTKHCEEYIN